MLPQNFNLDEGYCYYEKIGYIATTSVISEV